jgi:hypothetical protein
VKPVYPDGAGGTYDQQVDTMLNRIEPLLLSDIEIDTLQRDSIPSLLDHLHTLIMVGLGNSDSGSEYETQKIKAPRKSQTSCPLKVINPKKCTARAKGRPGSKLQKRSVESSSLKRPSIISALVSKFNTRKGESISTVHGEVPPASLSMRGPAQGNAPASMHKTSSPSLAHLTTLISSESCILERLNKDDDDIKNNSHDTSPLGYRVKPYMDRKQTAAQDLAGKDVKVSHAVIEDDPTKQFIALSQKRPKGLEPFTLSKKTRIALSVNVNAPATVAPVQIVNEPSSPCAEAQQIKSFALSRSEHVDVLRKRELDKSVTPLNHLIRRTSLGQISNPEVLSSNSKPLPAAPDAESMAISGHTYAECVKTEQKVGEAETARNDPFKGRVEMQEQNEFARRLIKELKDSRNGQSMLRMSHQKIKKAGVPIGVDLPVKHRQAKYLATRTLHENTGSTQIHLHMDKSVVDDPQQAVERTQVQVVNHGNNEHAVNGGTQVALNSRALKDPSINQDSITLARNTSPSSHSSTSAEVQDGQERGPSSSEERAEDLEWENSLQPHQRAIGDQLICISRRLLRHIVDNETAVRGVSETYHMDGNHLLQNFHKQHGSEPETVLDKIKEKKLSMKSEFHDLARQLSKDMQIFTGVS